MKQLEALAERYGADLFDDGIAASLWSPVGQAWVTTGCHTITAGSSNTTRSYVIKSITDDARAGLEPCTQPHCDTCEPQ